MHTRALMAFVAAARGPRSPAAQAAAIARPVFGPNDTFFSNWAWPTEQTDLLRAWSLTLGDPRVTTAVVDTASARSPTWRTSSCPASTS